MNNCRAGLYSFASTTTWLHETGIASPPLLVMLGLTLPNSRILSGVASVGLTLANVAAMLPHLRQPILHRLCGLEVALAHEGSNKEQMESVPGNSSGATQLVDSPSTTPVLAFVSPCESKHQSPLLSAIVKPVFLTESETLGSPDVESEVAPQTCPSPPVRQIGDNQFLPSLNVDSNGSHVISNNNFGREDLGTLYIPLPIPDEEKFTFFAIEDNTSSNSDQGEECLLAACKRHPVFGDHFITEDCESTIGEDINQDNQLVTPGIQGHIEVGFDSTYAPMPVAEESAGSPPMNSSILEHPGSLAQDTISYFWHDPPAYEATVQNVLERHFLVPKKEAPMKCRPESLEFIPQSVIRRYPSAPIVLSERRFGHCAINCGHDHQVSPTSRLSFVHDPEVLLQGTRPRASYTALEAAAPFPTLTRQPLGGRSLENALAAKDLLRHVQPEPTAYETTPKNPAPRRKLGVLARAALRDRRSAAYRRMDGGEDGSSTSDSDLDFDSDSQYSSGSSAYESILPHMLGADLIAAIDANSEPELNLFAKGTKRTPLNVYEDFLISDDSAADISMVMQVSSHDDASDGDVGAPVTFRSLTYEDIQQWATGVVQKCVRQVCRNHVAAEPSSPSQVSDVCAERPSGTSASRCPLSGLHCRLGAPTLTEVSVPRTKELPASHPAISNPPSRKPSLVRNPRDIPEFVPRQRRISTTMARVEDSLELGTRTSMDDTCDAVTRVIAKMENQVGFHARQWLVGTEEKRMVKTAGGRQGALRCA